MGLHRPITSIQIPHDQAPIARHNASRDGLPQLLVVSAEAEVGTRPLKLIHTENLANDIGSGTGHGTNKGGVIIRKIIRVEGKNLSRPQANVAQGGTGGRSGSGSRKVHFGTVPRNSVEHNTRGFLVLHNFEELSPILPGYRTCREQFQTVMAIPLHKKGEYSNCRPMLKQTGGARARFVHLGAAGFPARRRVNFQEAGLKEAGGREGGQEGHSIERGARFLERSALEVRARQGARGRKASAQGDLRSRSRDCDQVIKLRELRVDR